MGLQSQPSNSGGSPRILITNFHPGHGGGHLTYIRSIVTSRLSGAYEMAIGAPAASGVIRMARERGLKHFEMDFPGGIKELKGVVRSIRSLDSVYRRFPFEIIHTNGSRDHWIAAYWKVAYRRPSCLVRTRHASKKTRNDPAHRIINNRLTQANIFVSQAAKSLGEENGGLKFQNGIVIPNGVDLDHFAPMPKDEALAYELGISTSDFVFGSVAGLGPYKRVDLFLKAIAELPNQKDIKVLALGAESHARKLIGMARDLDLGDVFLYGGQQTDVRRHISLFDVGFVMSDAVENMSYASREMMAMGVPLISTNYCGLIENVDHGTNGILVTPGNLEEIKSAILRFLTMDRNNLEEMSKEARRKAEQSFSTQVQFEMLDELYRRVLRGTGAGVSPSPSRIF